MTDLKIILARLAAEKAGKEAPVVPVPKPLAYAKSDKNAASKILERLLATDSTREVSYITIEALQVNEPY